MYRHLKTIFNVGFQKYLNRKSDGAEFDEFELGP